MATRSTIARYVDDGIIGVESIYCHFDGYPDGVGRILAEHYTTEDKIDQLMELGDLSVLAEEVGTEKQDFNQPTEGISLAYGRDRGENDVGSIVHSDHDEWIASRANQGCEYGYIWKNGVWEVVEID
jgi:hypothetical protein